MRLSKNFTLEEFEASPTATRLHIDNKVYDPSVLANIRNLVEHLLQPLRDRWGKALVINSGYRCYILNRAVGGVVTSQHLRGQASDIKASNPYAFAKFVKDSGLKFDQMILYPTFVHLSFDKNCNRMNILYNKSYKGKKL